LAFNLGGSLLNQELPDFLEELHVGLLVGQKAHCFEDLSGVFFGKGLLTNGLLVELTFKSIV
jgi:hypothetical protein